MRSRRNKKNVRPTRSGKRMKSKNSLVSRKPRDNTRKRGNRLFFGGEGYYVTSYNIDDKLQVGTIFTREIIDCNWTDRSQCNELCKVTNIESNDQDSTYVLSYKILSINDFRNCTLSFDEDDKFAIGSTIKSGDKFKIKIDDAQSSSFTPSSDSTVRNSNGQPSITSNATPSITSNATPSITSTVRPSITSNASPSITSNPPTSSENSGVDTCKLELFYDDNEAPDYSSSTGDKYNFFDKIKRGLFSEFKDILHEDGLIKGLRVGTENTVSRMNKFWYLFHVVLSKEQPVTCLQYACMWNRDDFVILILQYLIGASTEFAKTYINYAADFDMFAKPASDIKFYPRSTKEHFTDYSNPNTRFFRKESMTAYDLVGRCAKDSWGIVSGLSQLGSIASNIPKAYYNIQYVPKVVGKTLKTGYNLFVDKKQNIQDLLLNYGGTLNSAEYKSVTVTPLTAYKTAALSQSGSSQKGTTVRYGVATGLTSPSTGNSNFLASLLPSSS